MATMRVHFDQQQGRPFLIAAAEITGSRHSQRMSLPIGEGERAEESSEEIQRVCWCSSWRAAADEGYQQRFGCKEKRAAHGGASGGCQKKATVSFRHGHLLHNPSHIEWENIVLREFLAADIQRIEGIGAVRSVFEEVFLGLRIFLHGLVFPEPVATPLHAS